MIITGKIPPSDANWIENSFINTSVPFIWVDNVLGDIATYRPGAMHTIFDKYEDKPSPLFEHINPIFQNIFKKHSLNFDKYLRIRYFHQPDVKVEESYKNDPLHTDLGEENLSLVYYLNEAGGGTAIFAEDIHYNILHKQGNYVIFDGLLPHAGILSQNNTTRSVINVNFVVK